MDKYTKSILSFLIIATLFISATPFIASGFGVPAGADSSDWYMTVSGVLDTDKYSLYPYNAKSLKIGFSKFGEMINSIENVGLEYGGERDPFAPPAGPSVGEVIPKNVWLEGWFINITYKSGITGKMRNVWATAQHADLSQWGNGWIRVDDDYPGGPASESEEYPPCSGYYIGSSPAQYGNGGRKTNGTVVTAPIEVLYDGPRRFVARVVNTISDWIQTGTSTEVATDVPLVQVIITIDFNKDKKEVNLFKDVKLIVTKGAIGKIPIEFFFPTEPVKYDKTEYNVEDWFDDPASPGYQDGYAPGLPNANMSAIRYDHRNKQFEAIFVQFSNRGQWDLGKPNEYNSYVHFFTEGAQNAPYDYVLPTTPKPQPYGLDENVTEGLATVYDYPYTLTTTIFPNYYSRHGPEPDTVNGDTFDLAQIIGSEGAATPKYVGFAAYWPSLSDWSVEPMDLWWKSLTSVDIHTADRTYEPFMSPYIIGEWDFLLSREKLEITYPWSVDEETIVVKADKQFRGVTTYGVVDYHSGDPEFPFCFPDYRETRGSTPYPDGYVTLGPIEHFWPWSAVWEYVERMEPYEKEPYDFYPYDWEINTDRWIPWVGGAYDDNMDKTLDADPSQNIIDQEVAYQLYEKYKPWDLQKASEKWVQRWVEFGTGTDDEYESYYWKDPVDRIHLEMTSMGSLFPFYSNAYDFDGVLGNDPEEVGEWKAYCSFAERVLVNGELMVRGTDYVIVFHGYGYLPFNAYVEFNPDIDLDENDVIKVLYSTGSYYYGMGQYEWITVGRESHPVDSLGAAMITEAFDSIKNIPVWKGALDIHEPLTPTVPSLLRKFGTGNTRADYYYSATDHRLALKDDWSSTVPIASSNIITVGGPLANLVTEYFNEFTMAIYRGMASPYKNDFLLVSDWGSTFLGGSRDPAYQLNTAVDPGEEALEGSGLGIVSTYKDINGTVGLVVYGYSGEDTYWTSKLFFNLNTVPLFLDNGNGILDWTDKNKNGLLDPEDLTEVAVTWKWDENKNEWTILVGQPKWVPKLHQWVPAPPQWTPTPQTTQVITETTYAWFAGDDLMLGFMYPDNMGNYKWFFMPLLMVMQKENPGVTDLVIRIYYNIPNSCNPYVVSSGDFFSQEVHPVALIVEELGRISEKPQHPDP